MFIPFVTARKPLTRRRGGGHSGGESGGGESTGSSGAGEAGTGSSGSSNKGEGSTDTGSGTSGTTSGGTGTTTKSSPVTISGTSKSATSYGPGGGSSVAIPAGQPFSGRMEGGGTRTQIFGTQTYGSGYPGVSGPGVANRGFPFFFWPLSFGVRSHRTYLNSNSEYGHADNSSRPGGVMTTASFSSNAANTTVFRILADNATTTSLVSDIFANCSTHLSSSLANTVITPYNETATSPPQPEQVIQYYRASSIALSLDGYNDTSLFEDDGTSDVPLPTSIDTALLTCLNQTIGSAAPLIDATRLASGGEWTATPSSMGLLGLMLGVWLSSMFI